MPVPTEGQVSEPAGEGQGETTETTVLGPQLAESSTELSATSG